MALVPTPLPPQGFPTGIFDPRNPTLIPNFYKPTTGAGIGGGLPSPADVPAAHPRVSASATATLGGTVTTGDIITLVARNGTFPSGLLSHSYTTVGGDTLSTIADALSNAFNDDPAAARGGLKVDAAAAVLTFQQNG